MNTAKLSQAGPKSGLSRVGVFSQRDLWTHLFRCSSYEFEDVIAAMDQATIMSPSHTRLSNARMALRNRASFSTPYFKLIDAGLNAPELKEDFDLFFTPIALLRDLHTLHALKGWRKRCGYAVCWLYELWNDDLDKYGYLFDVLEEFDHVICSMSLSVDKLRERISVPISYIPWGIDAVSFCPWPDPPQRVIDFFNIGALSPVTHAALLEHAKQRKTFYVFDTESGSRTAKVPAEHRWRMGDSLRRSRYFFTFLAKFKKTGERGVQQEFGLRFLEGAAGGTVLLGDQIDNPAFHEHLGWTDSVIQVPFECADIVDRIAELDRDPARLAEASRQNVLQSLKRHDYLYRWEKILELAGLEFTPGMASRREQLERLTAMVEAAA